MLKKELLSSLPKYYYSDPFINDFLNVFSKYLYTSEQCIKSIFNQFAINTADFTLERWERELGLSVSNNYDINYRQNRLISKLRGQGTLTINLIKNIANSFNNGTVDVEEQNNVYSIIIRFVDTQGTPPNLDDLKAAIEEVKPAHLNVTYSFKYLLIDDIKNLTIEELEKTNIESFAF